MKHIVFEKSVNDKLLDFFKTDESLKGDIFCFAQIFDVIEPKAATASNDTETETPNELTETPIETPIIKSELQIHDEELIKLINDIIKNSDEILFIWLGQNAHDVSGYFWLMNEIEFTTDRLQVIFLNNLPFINEKGTLYYPKYISEISTKELLKTKRLARFITLAEWELDKDEWARINFDVVGIRTLKGGKKIDIEPIDFYDNEIMSRLTGEWQKANRFVSHFHHKFSQRLPESFIKNRITFLHQSNQIELLGTPTADWKDVDIRKFGVNDKTELAINTEEKSFSDEQYT